MWINAFFSKLLTNLSKFELMNWKLSMKVRWLPNMKAIYFSILSGIAFIFICCFSPYLWRNDFRYHWPICYIVKWLSWPLSLWKITGILSISWKFRLQFWWLDPRYFAVIWQRSPTRISLSTYFFIPNVALLSFLEVFFVFIRHF